MPFYIRNFETLRKEVTGIRKSLSLEGTRVRLLGVSVSNLETEDTAMSGSYPSDPDEGGDGSSCFQLPPTREASTLECSVSDYFSPSN